MKAIILNISAWIMLPFMDAIAKYLSTELPFFQITWARYFFTVFLVLPLMLLFFKKELKWSENPKLQFYRGLTLFFANISRNDIELYVKNNKKTVLTTVGSYKIEENSKYKFLRVIEGDRETILGFPIQDLIKKIKNEK